MKIWVWSGLLGCMSFASVSAYADLATTYGYGANAAALAGAGRAASYDAFTSAYNASLMSTEEKSQFSCGFFGASDAFSDLDNVVIDNDYVGGTLTYGKVKNDVADTQVFMLGSTQAIGKSAKKFRLGFTLAMPVTKVMGIESKDVFQPQYAMYQADTQRILGNLSTSFHVGESWYFGVGAHVFFTTGASIQTRLPTDGSPQRSSSSNVKTDVKPAVAPSASATYDFSESQRFSFVYLAPRDVRASFDTYTGVGILGPNPVPINLSGVGSLFYDPEVYSLGYIYKPSATDYLFTLDYEKWSNFDGNILRLDFQGSSSFHQYLPDTRYRNILVPRFGLAKHLAEGNLFQLGYAYRASPVPDQGGLSNFLDSDRHILGLGYQWAFQKIWLLDTPAELSTFMQGQYLVPKHVVKSNPTSIGGPSYDIKGFVVAYGLSLTMAY